MEKPLLDREYTLKKFPGKGGWTYAEIPEVLQDKHAPFGWVKVRGTIDGFALKQYRLQPMGNGTLFLPVRAEIRKKIGKEAGDTVHITLFADNAPTEIPEEFETCLREDEHTFQAFSAYSDEEKQQCINWIYSAKNEEEKIARMAQILVMLEKNEPFRRNKHHRRKGDEKGGFIPIFFAALPAFFAFANTSFLFERFNP